MNIRDTGALLDSDLLLRTRLQRNLSQRQLARTIGLSAPVIGRLEAGEGHGALHLWRLHALADALGLPLTALLAAAEPHTAAAPDDVRVEAALLASRAYLRSEELARGLDWTHERTARALHDLRKRLNATGSFLYRSANGWTIIAREGVLDRPAEQRLAATQRTRRGLHLDEAVLLWAVAYQMLNPATESKPDRRTRQLLAKLLRAGLIEREAGRFHASMSVRAFLGIDSR